MSLWTYIHTCNCISAFDCISLLQEYRIFVSPSSDFCKFKIRKAQSLPKKQLRFFLSHVNILLCNKTIYVEKECIQSSHSEEIFRLTVSTTGAEAAASFLCSLLFPRPRRVADPWPLVLSLSTDTLVVVSAFICRRLYVTDVSTPLRLPLLANLGGSAETHEAREVEADFLPPERKSVCTSETW